MSMMFDIALAVMLALALVGGVVMTRRLTAFRESREDLAKLVGSLSTAVDRAHTAIAELKAASDGAEATLARRLGEVRTLADEVALMRDASEALARRLEQAAAAPRRIATDAAKADRVARADNRAEGKQQSRGARLTGLAAHLAALESARAPRTATRAS